MAMPECSRRSLPSSPLRSPLNNNNHSPSHISLPRTYFPFPSPVAVQQQDSVSDDPTPPAIALGQLPRHTTQQPTPITSPLALLTSEDLEWPLGPPSYHPFTPMDASEIWVGSTAMAAGTARLPPQETRPFPGTHPHSPTYIPGSQMSLSVPHHLSIANDSSPGQTGQVMTAPQLRSTSTDQIQDLSHAGSPSWNSATTMDHSSFYFQIQGRPPPQDYPPPLQRSHSSTASQQQQHTQALAQRYSRELHRQQHLQLLQRQEEAQRRSSEEQEAAAAEFLQSLVVNFQQPQQQQEQHYFQTLTEVHHSHLRHYQTTAQSAPPGPHSPPIFEVSPGVYTTTTHTPVGLLPQQQQMRFLGQAPHHQEVMVGSNNSITIKSEFLSLPTPPLHME
jgi:hypothetical protein